MRPFNTRGSHCAVVFGCVTAVTLCSQGASFAGAAPADVNLQLLATLPDQIVHVTNSGVAGDDRIFLVRKIGVIHIYDGASVLPTPFLDIDNLVVGTTLETGDERGLLSVAFHPDHDANGFFYVNYIDNGGDTVISRYQVSADPNIADAGSASIVIGIDQPAGNHNGGQLQFGPDGYLYIGMGDGGGGCDSAGSGCNAQKTSSLLGAMLRIDIDGDDFPLDSTRNYAIPASNPFVLDAAVANETWAYGLRNPWRFSFDAETGDLWIADVGQNAVEEINRVPLDASGLNYGWPRFEGDRPFDGQPAEGPVVDPVHTYGHDRGCSITGGFVYRGGAIPQLRGAYLYSDFCSGSIWALDVAEDGSVRADVDTGLDVSNPVSFGEGPDGELYVLSLDGAITAIVPADDQE